MRVVITALSVLLSGASWTNTPGSSTVTGSITFTATIVASQELVMTTHTLGDQTLIIAEYRSRHLGKPTDVTPHRASFLAEGATEQDSVTIVASSDGFTAHAEGLAAVVQLDDSTALAMLAESDK